MVSKKEVDGAVNEAIKCIEKAWYEVKKDVGERIWWDEKELIMSFYFYLRPMIDELNKKLEKIKLRIIPEYAPKAPSRPKKFGEKYPLRRRGEKELERTKKVDLCIVAFDSDDFEGKKKNPRMTYWFIRHAPVILLEFKLLAKEYLLEEKAMKRDLAKCVEIKRRYRGVERTYFCYLADKKLERDEYQGMVEETKIDNLRICYGTWNGRDWGIV